MLLHVSFARQKHRSSIGFSRHHPALISLKLAAVFLLTLSPAVAADREAGRLTMSDAVERSLAKHPELASYGYRVQGAEGYIQQSAIGERPELSVMVEDGLGTDDYEGLGNAKATLSVSWILERALLSRQVDVSQGRKALLETEYDIKRFDVAGEAAHKFVAIVGLQERLKIAKQARKHTRRILVDIIRRVEAGKAPLADQLRAEVSVERRDLEVEDVIHELKAAKKVLSAMWSDTDVDFSTASGDLSLTGSLVAYAELEKQIESSLRVQYFLTQQRLAESEVVRAQEAAKRRPRLQLGVSRYERSDDYALTLGMTLPVGSASRNQGEISALTAEQQRFGNDAMGQKIDLLTQVFVLYEELKHSLHISESLETKVLPRLEQALEETLVAYQRGKYSYQEWTTVQQEVLDARLALVDAELMAHTNTIELERLTGLALQRRHISP